MKKTSWKLCCIKWTLVVAALLLVLTFFSYIKTQNGSVSFLNNISATIAYPFEASSSYVINVISGFKTYVDDMYNLYDNNDRLKRENAELKNKLIHMVEIDNENIRLRKLMELKKTYAFSRSQVADVIAFDFQPFTKSIIINLGSSDKISINMPVITNDGVVGAVSEVYPFSARVKLITSPDMSLSATVQRFDARTFALAQGAAGAENYVELDNIPQNIDIIKGDRVVTRGLGGIFPKGLLIGEVVEVSDASGYLHTAKVKPAVNCMALEQVLVVTDYLAPKVN